MSGPLGSGEYHAELMARGGRVRLADMQDVQQVSWGRTADDTSQAQVSVALRQQSERCRSALAGAYAWAHELRLYRGATVVWEGPLQTPQWSGNRATVLLSGRDIAAWLDRRTTHLPHDDSQTARDLSVHAEALVRDAFGPDDPNVLAHLDVRPAGVSATWSAVVGTVNAGSELRNFAEAGLDWTVLGRRIVLFGPASPLGTVAELGELDFLTDALTVTQDGTQACTRALVVSQDPTFTEGESVPLVVRGQYGTTTPDPAIGLHEITIMDDSQVPPGEVAATATARATVQAANPMPLLIGVESGAALAPCAPVDVNELVPGVLVPIRAEIGGRVVIQTMQLVSVSASWSGTEGEKITVNLASLGGRNAG